jgi:hypothetical protein
MFANALMGTIAGAIKNTNLICKKKFQIKK